MISRGIFTVYPTADQVVELLRLLVELKINDYNQPLSETDTKLAFHGIYIMITSYGFVIFNLTFAGF